MRKTFSVWDGNLEIFQDWTRMRIFFTRPTFHCSKFIRLPIYSQCINVYYLSFLSHPLSFINFHNFFSLNKFACQTMSFWSLFRPLEASPLCQIKLKNIGRCNEMLLSCRRLDGFRCCWYSWPWWTGGVWKWSPDLSPDCVLCVWGMFYVHMS